MAASVDIQSRLPVSRTRNARLPYQATASPTSGPSLNFSFPVCEAQEKRRTGAAAFADCGRSRRGLAGGRGQERRDGWSDAPRLGDPVQRATTGRSHQHPFTERAAQVRRDAQGLSRPDRRGRFNSPQHRALAGVRSDHTGAPGVWALSVSDDSIYHTLKELGFPI